MAGGEAERVMPLSDDAKPLSLPLNPVGLHIPSPGRAFITHFVFDSSYAAAPV